MRIVPGWLLPAAMLAALAHSPPAAGKALALPPAAPAAAGAPSVAAPVAAPVVAIRDTPGRSVVAIRDTPGRAPAVELLSPQTAIPLVAGSTAVLQWAPLPGLSALPASEEWEAFLSLDGGRSYGVRITPHLDSDLRRALWEVPDAASADVRLLLRFGDERRETVIELPQRFTITPLPAITAMPAMAATLAVLAPHRGEAARPGDPGVVAWTEGSRRGTAQRQVVVVPLALQEGWRQPQLAPAPAALAGRPARTGPPAPARETACSPPGAGAAALLQERQPPVPPLDRLLQTSRLNE